MAKFENIADLKRQPFAEKTSLGGLPQPMRAQMEQGPKPPRRKVKYPGPAKPKGTR